MPVPGGTQNIICGQAVTSRPGPGQLPASKKYIQGKRLQIFCKQRVCCSANIPEHEVGMTGEV